ncbi:MAG: hypothetical protein WBL63_01475 [Candidatus Acidiferrum sp.]
MIKIPQTTLTILALLFACSPSRAQSPRENETKGVPRTVTAPCCELPAGNGLRFYCPPLPFLPEEDSDESSPGVPVRIDLMLPEGTPMRIVIDQRTRISHVGEAVHGHVVETVYAFDEPVIPAGSMATGHVTEIDSVSKLRWVRSYASGDFSPFHQYKVTFDRLTLPDGREIAIDTTVAPGAAEVIHLVSKPEKGAEDDTEQHKSGAARATDTAKQEVKDRVNEARATAHQAADEMRTPGRMHRLKQYMLAQAPYRRQFLTKGTRFTASLNQQLDFGSVAQTREQLASLGGLPVVDTVVHARLVLEVSSATATRGSPVVAELTQPVYSAGHRLILPSGSRLIGQVLEAKPARHLHRNGELRVIFEHIEVPGGALQSVQGTLEGIEVDRAAHMKLDEEGGAHTTDSKTRYLSTGIALLMVAAAAHPDAERGEVDQSGDPAIRAGAGASGFGLAGTLIGLAAKSNVVSIAFSAYGASASIYSNFLSRGREVVLPKNAPLEIGLGTSHPSGGQH